MKIKSRLLALLIVAVLLVPGVTLAASVPNVAFTGAVTIGGSAAPMGTTTLTAEVAGEGAVPFAGGGMTGDGSYFVNIAYSSSYAGKTITFKVNGVEGGNTIFPTIPEGFPPPMPIDLDLETYTLTANINPGSSGTVALAPPDGDPVTPGAQYALDTSVQLTANANGGWGFDEWTGDLTGSANPDNLVMNTNKTVTANFEEVPNVHLITGSTAGGTVTTPGEGTHIYPIDEVVSLVATPDAGYKFTVWTGDTGTIANVADPTTTIAMTGTYNITAVFNMIIVEGGLVPDTVTKTLSPGRCVTIQKLLTIPTAPAKVDVVFAFDLTGSMGGVLSEAQTSAEDIMDALDALGSDFEFGVISYMDYPHTYTDYCGYTAMYGDAASGDYAYSMDQSVTSSKVAVVNAINGLGLGWGADGPEDYTRALYESYADPNIGWRDGAKRILVNFADDIPHDCNLNEGVPLGAGAPAGALSNDGEFETEIAPEVTMTWSTGGDPGRDEIQETVDDLVLLDVLAGMAANGVTLLQCQYGGYAMDYWGYWAGLTGGDAILAGTGTMVDEVVAIVESEIYITTAYGVHLEVVTAGFDSWVNFAPASYDEVDVGDSVRFSETICVPKGTAAGTYTFRVIGTDDSYSNFGEQIVTITVPRTGVTGVVAKPASLAAAYLLVSPEQVVPNQQVEISINIGNDGGTSGTRSVALYINGYLEQSQTVTVSPGSAKNVVFRLSKATPGTYQVLLEGKEGQFTVLAGADNSNLFGGPLGTGGIIVIVVVAIGIIVAVVILLRRQT